MATKESTSLSTMLGSGETMEVKGKTYTVVPITLKDVEEFMSGQLSIGPQIVNIVSEESRKHTNKWLKKYCIDDEGKAVTLKRATDAGWDVKDLREFMQKLCDMSG